MGFVAVSSTRSANVDAGKSSRRSMATARWKDDRSLQSMRVQWQAINRDHAKRAARVTLGAPINSSPRPSASSLARDDGFAGVFRKRAVSRCRSKLRGAAHCRNTPRLGTFATEHARLIGRGSAPARKANPAAAMTARLRRNICFSRGGRRRRQQRRRSLLLKIRASMTESGNSVKSFRQAPAQNRHNKAACVTSPFVSAEEMFGGL